MISYKPRNTKEYLELPRNTCEQKKYPEKKLIVHFNTPTQPEPDLLTVIFFIPDPAGTNIENPTCWALLTGVSHHIRILGYHPGAPPAPKTTAHQV